MTAVFSYLRVTAKCNSYSILWAFTVRPWRWVIWKGTKELSQFHPYYKCHTGSSFKIRQICHPIVNSSWCTSLSVDNTKGYVCVGGGTFVASHWIRPSVTVQCECLLLYHRTANRNAYRMCLNHAHTCIRADRFRIWCRHACDLMPHFPHTLIDAPPLVLKYFGRLFCWCHIYRQAFF